MHTLGFVDGTSGSYIEEDNMVERHLPDGTIQQYAGYDGHVQHSKTGKQYWLVHRL